MFSSSRKDIIEILKRNDLLELQQFIDENSIVLKNLNSENFDILISAIEYSTSSDIIAYILNHVNYNTLDFIFSPKNNEYKYSFEKNIPLLTATYMNKFNIATLLMNNNANIDYIFNLINLYGNKFLLNNGMLSFLLNNGVEISEDMLKYTINDWLSEDKNEFLEILFKYYIIKNQNYKKYSNRFINEILYEVIRIENYKILELFVRNSGDEEENLLNIITDEIEDEKYHYRQNNKTCNENIGILIDKKDKFLSSISDKNLRIKIRNHFSRKKDIIEILKRDNIVELQQYISENTIKYLNSENFDILISAIECGVSNDLINYIINQFNYDSLDYCFHNINNEYEYSFQENIPLFTAIAKNEFNIADLLLTKKANMEFNNFTLFQYLKDKNVLNGENLKYILDKGLKFDNNLLEKTIYQWLTDGKNDLLRVIFKNYILNHFDELKTIETKEFIILRHVNVIEDIVKKSLDVENYRALEIFIRDSDNREEEILNILFDIFEDYSSEKENYIIMNDTNTKTLNNKDKRNAFLNSINDNALKTKIKSFLSIKEDIIEILTRNDLSELKQFIDINNIKLEKLNNTNFDILILAIEYDVSSKIINYIINQTNYDNLDYCFYYQNGEFDYSFNENIPLFTAIAKNNFEIATVLINNNADINYKYDIENSDIITYLYDKKCLNIENLKYILNNKFIIEKEANNNIIKKWISNDEGNKKKEYYFLEEDEDSIKKLKSNNEGNKYDNQYFLEIYLNHFKDSEEKLLTKKNDYYKIAIQNKNVEALILLLNYDKEERIKVLKNLYSDVKMENIEFLKYKQFKDLNFYYNKENNLECIDEKRFNELKETFINFFDKTFNKLNNLISKIKDILNNFFSLNGNNTKQLDRFIKEHDISFIDLKLFGFNILMHACKIDNEKIFKFLLKNNEIFCYENPKEIINQLISLNKYNLLQYYLEYASERKINVKIDDEYYHTAFNYENSELFLILYDNDNREKKTIISRIYDKYYKEYNDFIQKIYSHTPNFIDEQNSIIDNENINYNTRKDNSYYIQLQSQIKETVNHMESIKQKYQVIEKNKENICENLELFKNFIYENNIKLDELNAYNFDILIYSIEKDFTKEIIEFIIKKINYQTLDYYIEDKKDMKSPFLAAILHNRINIAEFLLCHGANINYEVNNKKLLSKNNFSNSNTINYLIMKGFRDSSYLIKSCFNISHYSSENVECQLKIILNHYIYNNEFITNLILFYKNKTAFSKMELLELLIKNVRKVLTEDIYQGLRYNEELTDLILKYEFDNKQINKINWNLQKYNHDHRNDDYYDDYYDYDDYYQNDYFDESGLPASYFYLDDYIPSD